MSPKPAGDTAIAGFLPACRSADIGTDFLSFITPKDDSRAAAAAIAEARACVERFSRAFNSEDVAGMDRELHFPHTLFSPGSRLVWRTPGQHPADLFEALRRVGWTKSVYVSIEPLLAAADKVDFVVSYERQDSAGRVISQHKNLWIVTREDGRWGIALRSY